MADYGGLMQLGDLARGIGEGVINYKEQEKKSKKEEDAVARALKERQQEMQMKGYQETPEGKLARTPEAEAAEKRKIISEQNKEVSSLLEKGLIGQYDESGKLTGAKRDASLVAAKEKDPLAQALLMERLDKAKEDKLAREQAKTPEGRLAKMPTEARARLDNARLGLDSVRQMQNALVGKDQNTFSLIGDNDFTVARSRFEEALGRMQSGGAITKDEEERFRKMAPTWKDSPEIQKKKLAEMTDEMGARLKSLGFDEKSLEGAGYKITQQSPETQKKLGLLPAQPAAADASAKAWAEANPNDPRAAKILEKLGGAKRAVAR